MFTSACASSAPIAETASAIVEGFRNQSYTSYLPPISCSSPPKHAKVIQAYRYELHYDPLIATRLQPHYNRIGEPMAPACHSLLRPMGCAYMAFGKSDQPHRTAHQTHGIA